MRRLVLAAAVLLASLGQGSAWQIQKRAAYAGPGDVVSFTAWYGVRAYSAAVAATGTQKSVDLRRVSDNATCTALIATDGSLDLTVGTPCNGNTQTVTAWVGASSAFVSKIYDQTSGNACGAASCDLVQATSTAQPQLLLTGCGGGGTLPCLYAFSGDGKTLISANNFTPAGTLSSFAAMAECTYVTGTPGGPIIKSGGGSGGAGTNDSLFCNNAAWSVAGSFATNEDSIAAGTYYSLVAIIDGASDSLQSTNGTDSGHFVMSANTTASAPRGFGNSAPSGLEGTKSHVGEAGWQDNTAWSAGSRTAICHNIRLYWGTGGAC